MGKTSNKLGAVVLNHMGYSVRQMLTSKTDSKTKRTVSNHTGRYGVYAGKKLLVDGLKQPSESLELINKEIADNKKAKAISEQKRLAEAKRIADANAKANRRVW